MRAARHELVGGASNAHRVVGREGIQGKATLSRRAAVGALVQNVRRQNAEFHPPFICAPDTPRGGARG
jgi:hypothetical protein